MQLTQYSDYSLRILIYLGLKPGGFATISEITDFYGISRNHLTKIVNNLANNDILQTIRGKHGGIRLAHSPNLIRIGNVIRVTEPNFHIAECFNADSNTCVITHACGLRNVLKEGLEGFWAALDQYTLADIVKGQQLPSPSHQSIVRMNKRSSIDNA